MVAWMVVAAMLLFPARQQPQNPWKQKVADALENARRSDSVAALAAALEVAWRADDWQAGLELARRALERHPGHPGLRGPIVRALWRAGELEQAERLAAGLPQNTPDRAALAALVTIHLARGEIDQAARLAERLERLRPATAADLYYLITVRLMQNRLEGIGAPLRQAWRLTDPKNGYPEIYGREQLAGLAEFLQAVGTEPLNQIAGFGAAPMPRISLTDLPGCLATINGRGPFRMIFDTGGSMTLSLDQQVAEQIGLKSVAAASIRGVSGKQTSGQALVAELRIGPIACRRVMTRIYPLREQIMDTADGIIGTGIFMQGRLTLDFEHARMVVSPSAPGPAAGTGLDLRIVGDAKLVAPLELAGRPAIGLLDSGANVVAFSPALLGELFPDHVPRKLPRAGLGIGGGAGPSISWGRGVDLVFAGRRFDNYSGLGLDVLDTVLSPMLGLQLDALIGMPVFREMRSWSVDFPRCRMWVHWLEP